MSFAYQKVKSVGKEVRARGPQLEKTILAAMRTIADVVGGTLGPGGQPVLIERQEHDMPPIVTKDGVTVFRHLGFEDASSQVILEAARDAAVRTASEAGDGTTTATILAESIVRRTSEFCARNRRVSPQRVTRRLMQLFADVIEPAIKDVAQRADLSTDAGRVKLRSVAKISANGDDRLADAVIECYDMVGDGGNVTITEVSGASAYEVERIEGYPINGMGYEDSCGKYASKFINDPGNQRVFLEKPLFVVYHGKLTEIQTMRLLMERIGEAWQNPEAAAPRHNVIIVATGFSEAVIAQLAFNFIEQTTINVVPLLAPISPVPGGQLGLLEDICAVTGAKLLDPLSFPMDQAGIDDLGSFAKVFEMTRFRTTILAEEGEPIIVEGQPGTQPGAPPNESTILDRVSILEQQAKQAASEMDQSFLQERIGKLTGGIARLKVIGSSSGELRERRDRAEDAICAVRGAIKHGYLPGGGWTLMYLADRLLKLKDPIVTEILCPALFEPVRKLFANAGYDDAEAKAIVDQVLKPIMDGAAAVVYDVLEQKLVDPIDGGVLDSVPAVLEAVRNSLSIATQLGTLGGTIVFRRDSELERREAKETSNWLRENNQDYVNDRPY